MDNETDLASPRRNYPVDNDNDNDATGQQQVVHPPRDATDRLPPQRQDASGEGGRDANCHASGTLYPHPVSPKVSQQIPMHESYEYDSSSPPTTSVLRKRTMSGGSVPPGNHFRNSGDVNNNYNSNPSINATNAASLTPNHDQNNNQQQQQSQSTTTSHEEERTTAQDMFLLQKFWRTYDTIIILSIFAVFGIVFRMMSATWFRKKLGSVFSEDSALGTNLPLNIWSCFLMGLLCSGREAMGIVHSKVLGGANPYGSGRGIVEVGKGAYRGAVDAGRAGVNRARGYGNGRGINRERCDNANSSSASENMEDESFGNHESSPSNPGLHRRRGNEHNIAISTVPQSMGEVGQPRSRNTMDNSIRSTGSEESIAGLLGLDDEFRIIGSHKTSEDEIREVQLRGLSRRIMESPSLVLFPAKKLDDDVMEHYESDPLPSTPHSFEPDGHFEIGDLDDDGDVESCDIEMSEQFTSQSGEASGEASGQKEGAGTPAESRQLASSGSSNNPTSNMRRQRSESNSTIEEHVDEMINTINDRVTTFRRIHVLDGWDVDTSPEKMKHIILLGLRVGFCGALSTFSSLNASVIRLLRAGSVGEALVGYALSIQLGILFYRFGQHLAVYIFVWRCRREAKRDEKRGGYGLRLRRLDTEEEQPAATISQRPRYISVRTIATLLFVAMFVSLCLAIYFVPTHQQYLLSLLFTPFGCLARWKLMSKYNKNLPGFPLGTFACNIGGCALSGSLASFMAGNPGPEESIVLTSMIAGFAGSLSTFAAFIVEILQLVDPIIFKFDGLVYAVITILWAVIIGYLGSQAQNWADEI
mmetsp:Transcript_20750/g.45023  ORF Transcript_20750/g.45023 Transcript_20750/m.45023 type:complete len:814 (-) Transcript_20750:52-2493(-)|eukprot:CAMPEP_0172320808 /NCGR_PEP_ID=MMETSP1058-20130122/41493_1 /TAXON_ID=83371 /ORGANISM="Detonula confervacea, Strain CCMP 353" /LENGTH=813 /DNA_ID=CAMNT_0013036157 /DNA_START=172 /DNA_END=2613 /DNA_ORIENTATION=+